MPDFENPQTYGEWYWANNLDVQRARSLDLSLIHI